jgi:type I restriction enzyme S subunit
MSDVLGYIQPTKYIVESTAYNDNFATPVLTAGQGFVLGYTDETDGKFEASKENPVIIFDDFTTSFHLVDFDFKVKSSAMKMLKPKNNDVSFRFLYHVMKVLKFDVENHQRQWISKYSQQEIALPPLNEQQRIVEILDKFDVLVNDLSSGLPAEIKARQEQYEFYRNQLLTFKQLEVTA